MSHLGLSPNQCIRTMELVNNTIPRLLLRPSFLKSTSASMANSTVGRSNKTKVDDELLWTKKQKINNSVDLKHDYFVCAYQFSMLYGDIFSMPLLWLPWRLTSVNKAIHYIEMDTWCDS